MTSTSVGAEVAAAIDAAVLGPVLVVGSPPPAGRDLDLLADVGDYSTIANWLVSAGFVRWRQSWLRVEGGSVYTVDLSSTERWRSDSLDVSGLFTDATPIPGYSHLRQPSPGAVLVLAARGMVTRRGRITQKVRGRVANALQEDARAWAAAEQTARALGLVGPLRLLRRAYEAEQPLPPRARATAVIAACAQGGSVRSKGRRLLDVLPRHWRPAVVSFSGLDGSGKSTQATALRETLQRLGAPSEIQWAGFKTASKVRAALPVLDRSFDGRRRSAPPASSRPRDPLIPAALGGHAIGRHLWLSTVATANIVSLWRYVLKPRHGTKVVIFDRFTPDTTVKLDLHYGVNRSIDVRWERALFAVLAPKPDVGFLVAVPSEVAYSRRQDQTPEELAMMARLYEEQVGRFGLIRLNGTKPPEDLEHEVLTAAWRGMR